MLPENLNKDLLSQHVLGHLLDVLDDDEREQVEQRLEQDSEYAQELSRWRQRLAAFAASRPDYEPPRGLADRTCRFVGEHRSAVAKWSKMSPIPSPPSWIGRVGWLDVSVVALLFVAVGMVLLPAICNSRIHARLAWCQDGLKQFGTTLAETGQQHSPPPAAHLNRELFMPVGMLASNPRRDGFLLRQNPLPTLTAADTLLSAGDTPIRGMQTVAFPAPSSYDDWLTSQRLVTMSAPIVLPSAHALNAGRSHSDEGLDSIVVSPLDRCSTLGFPAGERSTAQGEGAADISAIQGWNLLFEDGHAAFFTCASERDLGDAFYSEGITSPVARVFVPSTLMHR
jgi:hypothetical protein